MKKILTVRDLQVTLKNQRAVVRGVSFDLFENEILGIVGESGCGKSLTMQAVLKLVDHKIVSSIEGSIFYQNRDLLTLSEKEIRRVRGKEIGMIFQDPFSSFNPTMKVGKQVLEVLLEHTSVNHQEGYKKVLEAFEKVGMDQAEKRYHQYPHELSGGLLQRAMIAMNLTLPPKILIADEPTTALDAKTQTQILDFLKSISNISIIIISHDLAVISKLCDRMMVMYAGKPVEIGNVKDILNSPKHPYTQMLMKAHPAYSSEKRLKTIPGQVPEIFKSTPKQCAFYARCPERKEICQNYEPELLGDTQKAACFLREKNVRTKKFKETLLPSKSR